MENIGTMEHGKYKNYLKFDDIEINNIKRAMKKKYINRTGISWKANPNYRKLWRDKVKLNGHQESKIKVTSWYHVYLSNRQNLKSKSVYLCHRQWCRWDSTFFIAAGNMSYASFLENS